MIARIATPADAASLKAFLGEGASRLDFDRDAIIIVERNGVIEGALAARNVHYAHDLHVGNTALARPIVEALFNYAMGFGVAAGQREVLFSVSQGNTKMLNWMAENFVPEERGGRYFLLPVR